MDKRYEITLQTILSAFAILAGVWILNQIRLVVITLFIAFIFSLALDPLVEKLKKLKIPRPFGVFLVFSVFLTLTGGLLAYGFTPLVNQTGKFLINLPKFLEPVLDRLGPIPFAEGLQQQLVTQATILSANILTIAGSIVSNAVFLLTVLIFTFYFLLDWENIKERFVGMMNKRAQARARKVINSMERQLGGWLRGQAFLMFIVGFLTYLGLFALGVEYALPLAVIAGLFEVIPTLGPIIAGIPALLIGFGTSTWLGVWILVLYVVVQQLENSILVPNIMGRTAGLLPLTALIVLFIGAQLFGVVGLFLAIPTSIVLSILARDILNWNIDHKGKG